MRIISHRGNLSGSKPDIENSPRQIEFCIELGFDVEIDLWVLDSDLYLGHDVGIYKITENFLLQYRDYLWIHCKNFDALRFMNEFQSGVFNYFWHQEDSYTLTSNQYIWTYPNVMQGVSDNQVILDFTKTPNLEYYKNLGYYGVCLDYIT